MSLKDKDRIEAMDISEIMEKLESLSAEGFLTNWEEDFVDTMSDRVSAGERLEPGVQAKLREIYEQTTCPED